MNKFEKCEAVIIGIIIGIVCVAVISALEWLLFALGYWVACSLLGWTFSWKVAGGVYVLLFIIRGIFNVGSKNE